jgi:SAM-dependent methyltransferase
VRKGIVDMLEEVSPEVRREMKAWEAMRPPPPRNGVERRARRDLLRSLPLLEGVEFPAAEAETWRRHGEAVFSLCSAYPLRGRTVLELGAGRCWLAAWLARRGAWVVAVDILEDEEIGLGCAEAFLEEGVYFERVLCDMHLLPFRTASFDLVAATATLHHSPRLPLLLEEVRRVLKPGGRLVAANEPLLLPCREMPEEEKKGAWEGAYPLSTWLRRVEEAGFVLERLEVGREASLHFVAAAGGPPAGGIRVRKAVAMLRYLSLCAAAPPRYLAAKAREALKGRPMFPFPGRLLRYAGARWGMRSLKEEVLPGDEGPWGPGWYPPEVSGEAFRWSGKRARLLLPGRAMGGKVVLELASFRPSVRSRPVELEIRAGGARRTVRIDGTGWHSFRIDVPPRKRILPLALTLEVREGYFVPRREGLGKDGRLLGVACRRAAWE